MMNTKQTIIIGFIFLLSCSSVRQEFKSIEFISYNYFWNRKCDSLSNEVILRCFRYALINNDGRVLFYQWKKHSPNDYLYSKSVIQNNLIDSILLAGKKQKENNKDSLGISDGGPRMKVKISQSNGTYETMDFILGEALSKYFFSISSEEQFEPLDDTIAFYKSKQKLIHSIWIEDSTINRILLPPPDFIEH